MIKATLRPLMSFIQMLEERNDLHRIKMPVNCDQEIAAITDRVCKRRGGGPALLFEQVEGGDFPVITNLFGSAHRASFAWGNEHPERLLARFEHDLAKGSGENCEQRLQNRLSVIKKGRTSARSFSLPKQPLGLLSLPALRNWPGDGGRFLTLPLVYLRDPEGGQMNCGIYRMQILDDQRAALHLLPGSDGNRIIEKYARSGHTAPLAIALGGDPAWIAAAAFPLSAAIEESDFALWLSGRDLPREQAPLTGFEVPGGSEFVLEGEVCTTGKVLEGPFGNHTGYYAPRAPAPVFHLRALYHDATPVFPATVVGRPPMENNYLMRAAEPLILALLKVDHPEIGQIRFLEQGVFHGCVVVTVKKQPSQGIFALIRELWRRGPLKRSRLTIVCDDATEINHLSTLVWRLINRVDPMRHILRENGRMAIDGTALPPGPEVHIDPAISERVMQRWQDYGFD